MSDNLEKVVLSNKICKNCGDRIPKHLANGYYKYCSRKCKLDFIKKNNKKHKNFIERFNREQEKLELDNRVWYGFDNTSCQ